MESIEKLRAIAKFMAKGRDLENHEDCNLLLIISDKIEREIAERFMELPVDADGVPIRVGDKVQFRNDAPVRVDSIGSSRVYENDWGFFASNGGFLGQGTLCNVRHVKQRTVEDVLVEFYGEFAKAKYGEDSEVLSYYAAKIRDLMGVGE